MSRRWLLFGLLVLLIGACSGLAGEPAIVATLPPVTPRPTEAGFPVEAPDLMLGARIYAARCAECHGIGGAGDGPLVQSGQVQNAGNFRLPETSRSQTPRDWFTTITDGRIENLMPPWRDALSESERWAVALYTYTLHYSPEQLEQGRAIYAARCATCHGENGAGDVDLTRGAVMAALSDDAIAALLADHQRGDGAHAFDPALTEDERYAVAAFTRTLGLTSTENLGGSPEPAATAEATALAEPVTGTVRGAISNGSGGGRVPETLDVDLFVLDANFTLIDQHTATAVDGEYEVNAVTLDPGARYIARAIYRDRVYTSAIVPGSAAVDGILDLPVTIYELTEDPAVLTISAMVTQVTVAGESLEVAQVINITNTSDRAYSTSQTTEDGRPISVVVPLPPGAIVAGFGEQGRYVVAQDRFLVLDTLPVLPGEGHLIQMIYFIDYGGGAIIEQELSYRLDGQVRLLVRPETIRVTSEQLAPRGLETVGQSQFMSYGGALQLEAGSVIRYELGGTGLPVSPQGEVVTAVTSNDLPLLIALVVLGEIVLIGGLYYWYQRRRKRRMQADVPQTEQQRLVRQIAALDAAYEAGEIAPDVYERQRAELKERLTALIERE